MAPWLLVLFLAPFQDPAPVTVPQAPWTVELGPVRRVFERTDSGGWSTVTLSTGTPSMGGSSVPVTSREFTLQLADGRSLVPEGAQRITTTSLDATGDRQGVAVHYEFEDLRVVAEYFTTEALPLACKQLRLESLTENAELPAVTTWEVEHLTASGLTGGGLGQPALGPGFWCGLANPSGQVTVNTESLCLHHGPRRRNDRSEVALLGMPATDQTLPDALRALLAKDPPRQRVVFHEDLAQGANDEDLRKQLRHLLRHLSRSGGGRLDALVLDQDWWSDANTLTPDPALLPEDGGPLSHSLRDAGAGLGLGIPVRGDLSTNAERARLLHAVMGRLGRMPLTYVEHRVDTAAWTNAEQATENFLALLDAERRFLPSAWLSLEAPPWSSPWWLLAFNGWQESMDEPLPTPTNHPTWSWITSEDARLRQRFEQGIPLERVTVRWPKAATDPFTDRQHVERFLWSAARGSRELILPEDPSSWSVDLGAALGQVVRWCDDREEVLARPAQPVGGPPGSGRVHGYRHTLDDKAILILRNPSLGPVSWPLPASASPWLVTWPWCEVVTGTQVSLPGESFLCLETLATIQDLEDVPDRGRFRPGERGPRTSQLDLLMAPGEERRFRWHAQPDSLESRVGLARAAGRRTVSIQEDPPRLFTALEDQRIEASIQGMGAWFGEHWRILVRYQGEPEGLGEGDLVADTIAREFRALADGGLWILTPRTALGAWSLDLPLGSASGIWEIRACLSEELEVAGIARSHGLRALGTVVLPPGAWATERVHEFLLGRIAPLSAPPPPLNVPR